MIDARRSGERGHADHGWLDAWHTFSFAGYRDPRHMGFSVLRVLNQDRVAPGQGFATHGHQDMEIVTYVLEGELRHEDSMGNGSLILPGDVQLMSAGTGVMHSEHNASNENTLHLLQMWVLPEHTGTTPRYEQKTFPADDRRGELRLVVSPDGRDGSLTIGQDVSLFAGLLDAGDEVRHPVASDRGAWLHLARGRIRLGDLELAAGDGAGIRQESELVLRGVEEAELVLFDLP